MSKIKDALEKAKRLRGVPAHFALIEDETGVKDDVTPQAAKTKKTIAKEKIPPTKTLQ